MHRHENSQVRGSQLLFCRLVLQQPVVHTQVEPGGAGGQPFWRLGLRMRRHRLSETAKSATACVIRWLNCRRRWTAWSRWRTGGLRPVPLVWGLIFSLLV